MAGIALTGSFLKLIRAAPPVFSRRRTPGSMRVLVTGIPGGPGSMEGSESQMKESVGAGLVAGAGGPLENSAGEMRGMASAAARQVEETVDEAEEAANQARDKAEGVAHQARNKAQDAASQARDKAQDAASQARDKAQEASSQARDKAQEMGEKAKQTAQEVWGTAKETAQKVKETVVGKAEGAREFIKDQAQAANDTMGSAAAQVQSKAEAGKNAVKKAAVENAMNKKEH